jgi:hypothetical protein
MMVVLMGTRFKIDPWIQMMRCIMHAFLLLLSVTGKNREGIHFLDWNHQLLTQNQSKELVRDTNVEKLCRNMTRQK